MANVKRKQLTALKVRSLADPGTYTDGGGLALRVQKSGGKNWICRLTIDGRRRNVGLGGYPDVSLKDARARAEKARQDVWNGVWPGQRRVVRRAVPTFAAVAETVIERRRIKWTNKESERQWRSSFARHVFPSIGHKPIDQITKPEVFSVIDSIWTTTTETASRVKQRVSLVFKRAILEGYRQDNPCEGIETVLYRGGEKRHHPALPYKDVPDALRAIRAGKGRELTKLALEFLILTASRVSEVRRATWDEIDLDLAVWTRPSEHMKARREHRVPLSAPALRVLEKARTEGNGKGLIFPSRMKHRGPLSHEAFAHLLRKAGYGSATTTHGFRTAFRVWCAEATSAPWAVAEAALAHRLGSDEVVAYVRSDFLEQRRPLMDEWAKYVTEGEGE